MAKRIVISGYYGFGNVGDEAVLAGILSSFAKVIPDIRVTVLSADPARTLKEHPGVDAVHRYRLDAVVRAIRCADLLISGGGSLLQDVTSARSIRYYLFILRLARALRRKSMIYAQGIGPITNESMRKAAAGVLNRTTAISVRDPESKAFLESIGVNRVPIQLSADPSLLLQPDYDAAEKVLSGIGIESKNLLGVSLRPWRGSDVWLPQVCAAIREMEAATGATIVHIPMQQEMGDLEMCRSVGAGKIAPAGDVRTVKALIGRCEMVVGMRLHCLIFAASEGVPFVPIVYDPKVSSFAAMCRQPAGLEVEKISADSLVEAVKSAWQEREALKARLASAVPGLRERALLSAELAAKL